MNTPLIKTSIQELKENIGNEEFEKVLQDIKTLCIKPFQTEISQIYNQFYSWKLEKKHRETKEMQKQKILKDVNHLLDDFSQLGREMDNGFCFHKIEPISKGDIIREILVKLKHAVTIHSPQKTELVNEKYCSVSGKILLSIPSNYNLWVFQKVNGLYYHSYCPAKIELLNNRWYHNNLDFKVYSKWDLSICLVSEVGSNLLRRKISKGDKFGFSSLPRGVYQIKTIEIAKEEYK